MSYETKHYIIEYTYESFSTYEMSDMITAEDEYEAIDIFKKYFPEAEVQNVFVKINVKGVDYD